MENQELSGVFTGYKVVTLTRNGLTVTQYRQKPRTPSFLAINTVIFKKNIYTKINQICVNVEISSLYLLYCTCELLLLRFLGEKLNHNLFGLSGLVVQKKKLQRFRFSTKIFTKYKLSFKLSYSDFWNTEILIKKLVWDK